jgi:hypothetical protein
VRPVVGRIDHDRVLGDPELVEPVSSIRCLPIGAAGMPTFDRPVRNTLCPVMNDDRPAVQLCSPYESVKRMPSFAIRSMLGVRCP